MMLRMPCAPISGACFRACTSPRNPIRARTIAYIVCVQYVHIYLHTCYEDASLTFLLAFLSSCRFFFSAFASRLACFRRSLRSNFFSFRIWRRCCRCAVRSLSLSELLLLASRLPRLLPELQSLSLSSLPLIVAPFAACMACCDSASVSNSRRWDATWCSGASCRSLDHLSPRWRLAG
jgi:hypothetical protein